jgi:hypothetical protein
MADLCLSCKLCCTNGLFSSVPIRAAEVARLSAHHLPIVKTVDEWAMPFPCKAHDGCCSIYLDRPDICREYECDVLVAVSAGEMPELEARALLHSANASVAAVRARIPGNGDLWGDVSRYCEDSPEWRARHADLLFDLFELREILRKVDRKHR